MASISSDSNGNRTIQFVGADRKRRSIRLGKMPMRAVESIKVRVEALRVASITGYPVDGETARWVADRDVMMVEKLVAVGLIQPRESTNSITLGEFLEAYLARRSDVKDGTQTFYGHTCRNLVAMFGKDRTISSITAGDADDFRRYLQQHTEPLEGKTKEAIEKSRQKKPLAAATVARRCSLARTFFRGAVRRKLIDANPFEDIGGGSKANPERSRFIDKEAIYKVIDACPNAEWRLLVALSRFGGVRVPSEALTLSWRDIDWAANRMTVHSPKTEHHAGKATRVVPIFTELRPYLEDVFELRHAEKNADSVKKGFDFVLPSLQREAAQRGDWRAVNLGTRFTKIVKRAGLTQWPRLWHNLRASRQTELTEQFPSHVVSAWLGNSERIAAQHYLQVLDSHFEKASKSAVQDPVQFTAALARTAPLDCTANAKTLGFPRVFTKKVGDTGFEPVTSTV